MGEEGEEREERKKILTLQNECSHFTENSHHTGTTTTVVFNVNKVM